MRRERTPFAASPVAAASPAASEPRARRAQAGEPPSQGFPHREHLTGLDFLRVMAKGEKRSCGAFHLYSMDAGRFSAGISVSRKLGGAVERNRIKRILREALRLTRIEVVRPSHVVLVARPGCDRISVEQARSSLASLYRAANLTTTAAAR